jgi:hypothetical protein
VKIPSMLDSVNSNHGRASTKSSAHCAANGASVTP